MKSPSTHRPSRVRIPFLGVVYDPLEKAQVLDMVLARDAQAPFAAIVTPNSDHLVRIDKAGGEVRDAYLDAWLCLNDSRIVGFMARFARKPLTTVPGADLVWSLFHSPGFDPSSSVLLVGGSQNLFSKLSEQFGLENAAYYDAPMGMLGDPEKMETAAGFIEAHPARFVLLAIGSPQQELLAHMLAARGKASGIGLCIGAGVEFLVYPERRAPRWMSQMGLEWLFRLLREPRRLWRRYLVDSPKVFALGLREWRRSGRKTK